MNNNVCLRQAAQPMMATVSVGKMQYFHMCYKGTENVLTIIVLILNGDIHQSVHIRTDGKHGVKTAIL